MSMLIRSTLYYFLALSSLILSSQTNITTSVTTTTTPQPLTYTSSIRSTSNFLKNITRPALLEDLPSSAIVIMSTTNTSTHVTSSKIIPIIKHEKDTSNKFHSNVLTVHPSVVLLNNMKRSNDIKSISTSEHIHKTSSKYPMQVRDVFTSLDVDKNSELFKANQDILTWFNNTSLGFRMSQSSKQNSNTTSNFESRNETSNVQSFPGDVAPCKDDCSKNNTICVMGIGLKPHCGLVVDACHQLRCIHGECVSKDNLYKCKCRQGWVGTFCDKQCTLNCGENGFCERIHGNDTVYCICHWNYTGYLCDEKKQIISDIIEVAVPSKELEAWKIIITVALAAVSLTLTCVLLPYILWMRQWIPMRKLVFYLQEYEDDDSKEYDAFISYTSTPNDERFILQHLYPKLEKELHFKLCLHFRDFTPGEPIANNIIRAIENSRRTILILSPSFISSEWCRMEYQKAQHEMLKLKHKIIPIILEDISSVSEIDKNLKGIVDSVTYITWPGDDVSTSSKRLAKFWKLLELSMPKKRSECYRQITPADSSSSSSGVRLTDLPMSCSKNISSTTTEQNCSSCFTSSIGSSILESEISGTNIEKFDNVEQLSHSTCSPIDQPIFTYDLQHERENEWFIISLTPPLRSRWDVENSVHFETIINLGKQSV